MRSTARSNWARLLLLPTLSVISACAHVSTTPPANSYCAVAKPIHYNSKIDSPKTVAQVEAHNSTWVCLCEADCPAKPADTR